MKQTTLRNVYTWGMAAVLSGAILHFVFGRVLELGYYAMPGADSHYCLITKAPWMWRRQVQTGKVALVKTPHDQKILLRIAAMPGDTVCITDATLSHDETSLAIGTYKTLPHTPYNATRQMREEHDNTSPNIALSDNTYRLHVLRRQQTWQYWTYALPLHNMPDAQVYPRGTLVGWNLYQWGPMRMPRQGDQIKMDAWAMLVYAPMISTYEKNTPREGEVYTFRHNYYFAIADDRDTRNDCRTFGPIPEHLLLGRARKLAD